MNSKIISKRFSSSKPNHSYSERQIKEISKVKANINNDYLLEKTTCPCGGNDYCIIAETERYSLPLRTVVCNTCGSLRFQEYLTAEDVAAFYTDNYQLMYGRLVDIPKYYDRQGLYGKRILESYRHILDNNSNVLEIGCGAGGALDIFHKEGMNVYGCEYSQTLVNYANGRGLNGVVQGSLFDNESSFMETKFDLIYMHHVFEHVSDPIALLKKCGDLLSHEGRFVVGVPDFLRIDQFENPGCDLMMFLHIAHKYNFTKDCFHLMGKKVGMAGQPISLHADYSTPWAIQPELWFEFFHQAEQENSFSVPVVTGAEVYEYLVATEAKYECRLEQAEKSKKRNRFLRWLKGHLRGKAYRTHKQ